MSARGRERKGRELHMAPTLLPTFTTTTTTNDRGREGAKEGKTTGHKAPQGVRGSSVNPSINQPAQISTLEQKLPPSPLSHPIPSQTTLSDAPWLSPSKNRKLLCHTHTHTYTPYHFPFSIITVCCNEKSQ